MVKRNKRNIGKRVKIASEGSLYHNREGIIKGFRGDHCKGDPYVQVFLFSTRSIWPFAGSILKYIETQTLNGEGLKMTEVIHIRKRRVKVGGNQYYKSDRYSAPVETLCGAPVTSWDVEERSYLCKSYNPAETEAIQGRKFCTACLLNINNLKGRAGHEIRRQNKKSDQEG